MRSRHICLCMLTTVALFLIVSNYTRTEAAKDEAATAAAPVAAITPADVEKLLKDGNDRWVSGTSKHPNQDIRRRQEQAVIETQQPFAAVLSCADSRVPVEAIFDAGIGDLFVVRVAGNVSDVDEIGTLEYGVDHLHINTIVILGHTRCGAVTAVVKNDHVTPNIEKLVDNIVPAVKRARIMGDDLVNNAIRLNVRQSIDDLVKNSDTIKKAIDAKKLQIVGGVYNLETGKVDWLN